MSQLRSCRRPHGACYKWPELRREFGLFLIPVWEETSRELLRLVVASRAYNSRPPWRAESTSRAPPFSTRLRPQLNRFHSLIPRRLARAAREFHCHKKAHEAQNTYLFLRILCLLVLHQFLSCSSGTASGPDARGPLWRSQPVEALT